MKECRTATKTCVHCQKPLLLMNFAPSSRNADGLMSVCNTCRERNNANRRKNQASDPASSQSVADQWERLAGDLVGWYHAGRSFETMGKNLQERAEKLLREQGR